VLKSSVVGETESSLTGALLLSDDASSSDCADAGRANAASKNNSEKPRAAIDRVNDLSGISILKPDSDSHQDHAVCKRRVRAWSGSRWRPDDLNFCLLSSPKTPQ